MLGLVKLLVGPMVSLVVVMVFFKEFLEVLTKLQVSVVHCLKAH